jgi:predicted amidophosphoribosyltransferase
MATGGAADVTGVEVAKPLCRLCREGNYAFDRARSYGLYNDALHHAILLLKYEEVTRLGDWFAACPAEIVAREGEAFRAEVIVPVPLPPDRHRERGIDRAAAGASAAFEAGRVSADAHKTAAGAASAVSQRTLGICTWRVRDSQRAAG